MNGYSIEGAKAYWRERAERFGFHAAILGLVILVAWANNEQRGECLLMGGPGEQCTSGDFLSAAAAASAVLVGGPMLFVMAVHFLIAVWNGNKIRG